MKFTDSGSFLYIIEIKNFYICYCWMVNWFCPFWQLVWLDIYISVCIYCFCTHMRYDIVHEQFGVPSAPALVIVESVGSLNFMLKAVAVHTASRDIYRVC